jgi:hypothetical protein
VLEIEPTKEEKKRKIVGKASANTNSCQAHRTVRCSRLAGGELATLGKTQRHTTTIHRTVRWCTGLSGEPTVASVNGRLRNPRATRGPQQRSVGHTRLSGVHRTVSGAPTDPEDQRSDAPDMEGDRAPDSYSDCLVVHQRLLAALGL